MWRGLVCQGRGGQSPRTPPTRHPAAGGEAALLPGSPHPATWRPPHLNTKQPVGRRPRAAPLAVRLAFGPTPLRGAARQKSGPSRFSSFRNDLAYCNSGVQLDGLALRRSRIWVELIRAWVQVLRMFVVGMRRKSGRTGNPFVCHCSPCTRPNRARPIGGLHRQTDRCGALL